MSELWNAIVEANKTIKTTPVKGKQYAEVNQRVKAFRMVYPDGRIDTDIITKTDEEAVVMAKVYDGEGRMLGSGTAQENRTSSNINRTSYVENCETSAVGRALGFAGFGIDLSIASAEEVQHAIEQQEGMEKVSDKDVAVLRAVLSHHKEPEKAEEQICKGMKVAKLEDMTKAQLGATNQKLEAWLKEWDARHAG